MAEPTGLISAAMRGDLEDTLLLLSSLGENQMPEDSHRKTPLHWACYYDETKVINALLTHSSTKPNCTSVRGETPLHIAAVANSPSAIEVLLKNPDVHVNAVNIWSETALHLAGSAGNLKAVEALCRYTSLVDFSIEDLWQRTALQCAKENGYSKVVDFLESHLLQEKKQPSSSSSQSPSSSQSSSTTPSSSTPSSTIPPSKPVPALSKLVEYPGKPEQIEDLLRDKKVIPEGKDMFGWTALHKFASWDKPNLIRILLPYLSVQSINQRGGPDHHTPLHSAIEMNAIHSVKCLLEHSSTHTGLRNKSGLSPLEYAQKLGLLHLVAELEADSKRHRPPPPPSSSSPLLSEFDEDASQKETSLPHLEEYHKPEVHVSSGMVAERSKQVGDKVAEGLEQAVAAKLQME